MARQRREPGSLLNWMERLIRRRRECPELGWGEWSLLAQDDPAVFAHRVDWGDSTVVAVHNLAGRATRGAARARRARACSSTSSAMTTALDGALRDARARAVRAPLVPAAAAGQRIAP